MALGLRSHVMRHAGWPVSDVLPAPDGAISVAQRSVCERFDFDSPRALAVGGGEQA